jgi:predicted phage tail protein
MTKPQIALIGVALFSAAITTTVTAATIDLPQYGFSIEALDAPPSTKTATMALMTFLPDSEEFAPNINVNIQPYPGSMASYITMWKDQFKQMNLTIVAEKQNGENEWVVEYSGPSQGKDLHFYARAVSNNGKVYLVTATATESQWKRVSEVLRKSVDAFTAR